MGFLCFFFSFRVSFFFFSLNLLFSVVFVLFFSNMMLGFSRKMFLLPSLSARLLPPSVAPCSLSSSSFSSSSFQQQEQEQEQEQKQEQEQQTLSLGETIKSLIHARISGTLSTVVPPKLREEGQQVPLYGSLSAYILPDTTTTTTDKDSDNTPPTNGSTKIGFGLINDSRHITHLEINPQASLVLFPLTPLNTSPSSLPLPRLNITGHLLKLTNQPLIDTYKNLFQTTHPGSTPYLSNYTFYELSLTNPSTEFALFHPTTNKYSHLTPSQYRSAPLDPLSPPSRDILSGMNESHSEDLAKLVSDYAGIKNPSEIFMYFVDRFGCNILVGEKGRLPGEGKEKERTFWSDVRLPFPFEVDSEKEFRRVFREAIQHSREGGKQ